MHGWAFCAIAAGVAAALSGGCGRGDTGPGSAASAGREERPAPGTMKASEPEPIQLESLWNWKSLWEDVRDAGYCKLTAFGLKDQTPDVQGKTEYAVEDADNHLVFAFESNGLVADKCTAIRIELPGSKHAGLWWAREEDIGPKGYPFARERFEVMRETGPGLFETVFAEAENAGKWTGTVRFLRIDTYGAVGDVVPLRKMEARVVRTSPWVKTDAIASELKAGPADEAMALLMRAKVTGSLDAIEEVGALWYASPWYATGTGQLELRGIGKERGIAFLEAGDTRSAMRAFSAAARGGGLPVEFLHDLRDSLSDTQRRALWPAEPYLLMMDFSAPGAAPFEQTVEKQGRKLIESAIDAEGSRNGQACAHLSLSASKREGGCLYAIPTRITLSEHPFALRVPVRLEKEADIELFVGYWFQAAKKASSTNVAESSELGQGWRLYDVRRDFHKEQKAIADKHGYDVADGVVSKIGLALPQGPENQFWVESIEVYIPEG